MKKKLITKMMLISFMMPTVVFAKTASTVGCAYGFGNIDTTSLSNYVNGRVSSMGYQLFNTNNPSRSILEGQPISGQYFLESDIIYMAGHSDAATMSFYNCSPSKVGINRMNQTNNLGSDGYFVGIGVYNLSRVKFAMLEGCETAQGSFNLASQFVSYGAQSSLGWSTDINTFSAKSWLTRFWDKIASGGTISEANDYANSAWYAAGNIKNTVIYGNRFVTLNPITYSLNTISKKTPVMNENEYTFKEEASPKTLETIYDLIRQHINRDFAEEYTNVSIHTSNGKDIYDIGFKVGDIILDLGYTVFVENGFVTKIYDNTNNQDILELIRNVQTKDISDIVLTTNEEVHYNPDTNQLYRYKEVEDIDPLGKKMYNMEIYEIKQ